ncbi:MAG TPA: hypothetical protein VGD41_08030, partial [Pyrinomonadaceae bacterium]
MTAIDQKVARLHQGASRISLDFIAWGPMLDFSKSESGILKVHKQHLRANARQKSRPRQQLARLRMQV